MGMDGILGNGVIIPADIVKGGKTMLLWLKSGKLATSPMVRQVARP